MSQQKQNLMSELDAMVKRAAAAKAEVLAKKASIGDNVDDKTKPATTGEQAAANLAANKTRVEGTVDNGAKPNKADGSVQNHVSDGAAAASPDGSGGATGGVLAATKVEPLTSGDAMKTARDLADALRKEAIKIEAPHIEPGGKALGSVVPKAANPVEGGAKADDIKPVASKKTAGIRAFLAKAALANENVKTAAAAEGLTDEQVGDAAGDNLLQQLESGQVSDEEATKILEEALASGAISEEDIAEALQGHPALSGEQDPAAAAVQPDPAAAAAAPVDPAQLEQAKVASAHIGPEDSRYIQKLASLYAQQRELGYAVAVKLAAELTEEGAEKKEDKAIADLQAAQAAEKKEEVKEDGLKADTPEEKAALAQAQNELGLTNEQMQAVLAAPAAKTASAVDRYRAAILTKVAALQAAK